MNIDSQTNPAEDGETQRGRRPNGVSPSSAAAAAGRPPAPDSEVTPRATRRSFSKKYKLQVLEQADKCTQNGEIGALLRREGLYSSHLSQWRHERRDGFLGALSKGKAMSASTPGEKANQRRIQELEQQVDSLNDELERANTVIDIQKKLYLLLGSKTNPKTGNSS